MQGLMQDVPLTLDVIVKRAEQVWATKRLRTATPAGVAMGRSHSVKANPSKASPTRSPRLRSRSPKSGGWLKGPTIQVYGNPSNTCCTAEIACSTSSGASRARPTRFA